MLPYKIITAVSTEPVSLADVKLHLRLTDDTTDDPLITSLIERARLYCESYTGRAFASQTLEAYLNCWPSEIELPMPPLTSVTSVKYTNSAGTETTMTETTQYLVDTDSDVGRIVLPYGVSWPSFTPYPVNPIKIRFVTGYTATPEPLKQALLLMIGNWYENREDAAEITGGKMAKISFSAAALMAQYRVRWL